MPSFEGVAKTARYSVAPPGRWVRTYVPVTDPNGIVPTLVQVVVPTARRWRVTVRPDTALPPRRPYASASTTFRVAVNVADPPPTITVDETASVRTVDRSRHVEYLFDAETRS